MKICFLENTKFEYSFIDIHSSKLRGAENVLINLSNQLSLMGHNVTIFNNCSIETHNDESNWFNINHINSSFDLNFDIVIANGDAKLFKYVSGIKIIVFSYSLQNIEKFLRKGQLIPYLKYKPTYFVIGDYHLKNRSKLLSLYGVKILNLAIDSMFHNTLVTSQPRENIGIFTSRGDRNLNLLNNIWCDYIYPKFDKAKLFVTPHNNIIETKNIYFRKMSSREDLIKDLLRSKVFLIPGHKAELFCLAAAEAEELCIPIVTLGIGSLYERVNHNVTGFIAKNNIEFADYTIELFHNESLWLRLHKNMINLRGQKKWSNSAFDLISKLKSL